jgi:hypothetical protein
MDFSMHPPILTKYGFRIRTRIGLIVDRLMIHGRDEKDAQRKLRQMYRDCEILECICHHGTVRTPVTGFEKVAALVTR